MSERRGAAAVGAVAVAACPALCVGLPLVVAGGLTAGVAAVLGGVLVTALALAVLVVGLVLVVRRRRAASASCHPAAVSRRARAGGR